MSAAARSGIHEALFRLRLFAGIPREVVVEIVRCIGGEVKRFEKGEIVVYEGTKAKWVVPVLCGRLNVFESASSGERHLGRVVDRGDLFGATLVTSNLEYYPGMACAAEPSEVVFFEISKIKTLWRSDKYARFFENLYSIVSAEVLESWRKLSILSCKKAEDRFMLYLRWRASEVGESDIRMPFTTLDDAARYLGLSRTALSLAVQRLVKRGEIAHPERGRFVIRRIA